VTNNQEAAAAAATVSDDQPRVLLKDLFGQVAGCFPRRDTRQAASRIAAGLLMELEDYNCWSIAEAAGHRGPHRLQHLLSPSWTTPSCAAIVGESLIEDAGPVMNRVRLSDFLQPVSHDQSNQGTCPGYRVRGRPGHQQAHGQKQQIRLTPRGVHLLL
jgi:hypothetical protein